MATVIGTRASAGVQGGGLRVGLVARTAVYSAGSMSNGDVIQMLKIPANAQVFDLLVKYSLTGQGSFSVGDGISTARYITDTAGSLSAGITRMTNQSYVPYTYSADDTIDITYSSSVNASSGAVYLMAVINMDP